LAAGDRERWDHAFGHGQHVGGAVPRWLDDFDAVLPKSGRALDVASGAGRVARYWAARWLETLAVDVSSVGLGLAKEAATREGLTLETCTLDLELDLLPDGPFQAVSCFHYLQRSLFPSLIARLATGGVLVCEIATVRNLERHASPGARFLLQPGELAELCRPLAILTHQEGWFEGSFLARIIARR
jgi:tellurite methyltransferase